VPDPGLSDNPNTSPAQDRTRTCLRVPTPAFGRRRFSWITDLLTLTSTSSLPQTAINLRFDLSCTGVDIVFIVFGQVTTPITPEFVTIYDENNVCNGQMRSWVIILLIQLRRTSNTALNPSQDPHHLQSSQ